MGAASAAEAMGGDAHAVGDGAALLPAEEAEAGAAASDRAHGGGAVVASEAVGEAAAEGVEGGGGVLEKTPKI